MEEESWSTFVPSFLSTYQLGLESVLQLEPQVVGLRSHSWIRPPWSQSDRSGSRTSRHPHHWWVTSRGHPLRPHVTAHRGVVKPAIRRHPAVTRLATVVLTVQGGLHAGCWVHGAQVVVLV